MEDLNANQITRDEYGTLWLELGEELYEVFTPDEDQNETAMLLAGYVPIGLVLGDVSAKHRNTVYENDKLFIKR